MSLLLFVPLLLINFPPFVFPQSSKDIAFSFLRRFGYLSLDGGDGLVEPLKAVGTSSEALIAVQKFGGIPETGELDNATLQLMQSPRCGLPDIVRGENVIIEETHDPSPNRPSRSQNSHIHNHPFHHHSHHHLDSHHHKRKRRYVIASPGWKKKNIHYYISNWSSKMTRSDIRNAVDNAFNTWSEHARLSFIETSQPRDADLQIGFYRQDHGDQYPFDGVGQVLAHAYYPPVGDIHFDDDENWYIEKDWRGDGVDFNTVALHEIGHSLGLSHSHNRDSVMNPYYSRKGEGLGYDDVLAVYKLYVSKSQPNNDDNEVRTTTTPRPRRTKPPRTNTPTTPKWSHIHQNEREREDDFNRHRVDEGDSNACNGDFNVVSNIRGELFILKGEMLWRLKRPGEVHSGYPVRFSRFFHKLPQSITKIDTIYTSYDGSIIFFTGKEFWVFDGYNFIEDSPQPIANYGASDATAKIDAVTKIRGKTYVFSAREFWLYDEKSRRPVTGSRRLISDVFGGIPSNLDSALTWTDGVTYFFKGDRYWAYNHTAKWAAEGYPKSASNDWLNC